MYFLTLTKTLAVLIHQLIGQSDEYFPNAKTFLPERWIRGDPQESHHHPYALLPFGFGLRMCLGRRLAELEMWQLTITVIVKNDANIIFFINLTLMYRSILFVFVVSDFAKL